jgi:hypothetical protein
LAGLLVPPSFIAGDADATPFGAGALMSDARPNRSLATLRRLNRSRLGSAGETFPLSSRFSF